MSGVEGFIFDRFSVAQEQMIRELTSQLARVDSLNREGKTSTLHFLTREAADEERRGLQSEVERLEEVVEEQKKTIATWDAKIRELDTTR